MVDRFKLAKEWLYQELGYSSDHLDMKKLNTLSCLLDEIYQCGKANGYDEGYDDGYNDCAKGFRKVLDI